MPSSTPTSLDRRTLLASVGALAGATTLAGCPILDRGQDSGTTPLDEDRARSLAERFAPTLYFDEDEQWFPTDPRPFTTETAGETVVDGFAAFNGYVDRFTRSGDPPAPTVFYRALGYNDSPLAVVQFWYYSVFDQFTTNFHWHDWEVLHVFVDLDTGAPQLFVASAHSGRVPNNEFLDPDPEQVPRILSELGSHSSTLSVNDVRDRFQRLPFDGTIADITNAALEGVATAANIPVAYGLPRDEGSRLPYVLPELNGEPIYEHERLPAVGPDDLIPAELTIRSFDALSSPPRDLPGRDTGLVFGARTRDEAVDVPYELVPASTVDHIAEFTGPQLSFEFAIPAFAEDLIAHHISTAGVPWEQARYDNPAADISDPTHRQALADRYEPIGDPAPVNALVASVREAVASDDAPEGEGLTTRAFPVEAVTLFESEPAAVPTFGGLAVVQDASAGEHRLTVNAPGVEPHSETVTVEEDGPAATPAGVDGAVPLVAREHAIKLEVDTEGTDAELTDLAVEDDFAGRLYDAPLSGPDAVYLHRGGAYTTEVRDAADDIGAFRVNPTDGGRVRIAEPNTGAGQLATYLGDVAAETSAAIAAVVDSGSNGGSDGGGDPVRGLVRALDALADAARQAADSAAAGDRTRTDERIATVRDRLDRVDTRLAEATSDLPNDLALAIDHRLDQLQRRTAQAQAAETL